MRSQKGGHEPRYIAKADTQTWTALTAFQPKNLGIRTLRMHTKELRSWGQYKQIVHFSLIIAQDGTSMYSIR
jgi:hypothetical protein